MTIKILINLLIVFISALGGRTLHAGEPLNYIQSSLLRLSSQNTIEKWVLPFFRQEPVQIKKMNYTFKNNFLVVGNGELPGLFDDITSDNEPLMQKRINESYGQPTDTATKISIGGNWGRFTQELSFNAGEVFILNNPVFPELETFLFYDFYSSTSYRYQLDNSFELTPKLSLGPRRIIQKTITTGDLLAKSDLFKINKRPWVWFFELSLEAKYNGLWYELLLELNSIPLVDNDLNYWEVNLGARSANLLQPSENKILHSWDLFVLYSPLYGGDYDVRQTWKWGTGLYLSEHLGLDIFFNRELDPSGLVKLRLDNLDFSFFSMVKYYDHFKLQRSRSFGLNLRVQF